MWHFSCRKQMSPPHFDVAAMLIQRHHEVYAIPDWLHHHHRERQKSDCWQDICRREPHLHQGEPEDSEMPVINL